MKLNLLLLVLKCISLRQLEAFETYYNDWQPSVDNSNVFYESPYVGEYEKNKEDIPNNQWIGMDSKDDFDDTYLELDDFIFNENGQTNMFRRQEVNEEKQNEKSDDMSFLNHKCSEASFNKIGVTDIPTSSELPEQFDWRDHISAPAPPIKNQGDVPDGCGSCWALSTTTVLEWHYNLANNQSRVFSAQQLVNCSGFNQTGCESGGSGFVAIGYVLVNGLALEETYPYVNIGKSRLQGPCTYNTSQRFLSINGSVHCFNITENAIQATIKKKGPVLAEMEGYTLLVNYTGGIFEPEACKRTTELTVDHQVVIIGWGVENGVKYWIVQNGYGPDWGENGYFRIRRGENYCFIESFILYPLL